jgi:hypothetical protein
VGYWRHYLYLNAAFFYRYPKLFRQCYLDSALAIVCQTLDSWLDQVALSRVIHSFVGDRNALEPGYLGSKVSYHYRLLPLLHARESGLAVDALRTALATQKINKLVKTYELIRRVVYEKRGPKVRVLFDQDNLPRKEQKI